MPAPLVSVVMPVYNGERFVVEAVRSIVEVGARDCAETLDFHRVYSGARILAFECNPATLPASSPAPWKK